MSQWDKTLDEVEYAVNNTVNRSTNEIPTMLLYGIKQLGKSEDEILKYLNSYILPNERDLNKIRQDASDNIERNQYLNKLNYDSKHKLPTNYTQGDLVLINNYDVTSGVNKKLIPKFKGPYVIKKVLPNDRFVVSDISGFQQTQRPYEGIHSAGNMKMWQSQLDS